jgi:ferric-dicitrate binding protein FerR (iron transport regulator)
MSSPNEFDSDDDEIAELLRQTGTRAEPPQDMMREVQAAVHSEWRDVVAARRRRRTFLWAAAAASICALALATTIGLQLLDEQGTPIATLQRVDGEIFLASNDNSWSPIREGHRIAVGESVRSDARAALRLDNGLALRIDRGTSFKLVSSESLALNTGAVYVDATPGASSDSFSVATHAGAVRHLGTQYQVRMQADGIDVSVREGRVMIERERSTTIANAGERLEISTQGSVQRSSIASTDVQWQWASEVAPPFAIENASLADFLNWISRETGRALVYESAAVQSTAAGVTLHGSIDELAPDVALTAVLATTPLRRDETRAEVLSIVLATSIDSSSSTRPTP